MPGMKKATPIVVEIEDDIIEDEDDYFTREVVMNHVRKIFDAKMEKLYLRYIDRCRKWSVGRNRITFIMGNYVVKLPWGYGGIGDNDWEGSVSTCPDKYTDENYVQYARTRMHYEDSIPVVFMEYVKHCGWSGVRKRLGYEPNWTACVDSGQIGYNRHGRLVAYDYGRN